MIKNRGQGRSRMKSAAVTGKVDLLIVMSERWRNLLLHYCLIAADNCLFVDNDDLADGEDR